MAVIIVPSSLRRYTEQQSRVTFPADDIRQALEHFAHGSTALRNHLFSGDSLRKFVVVCKNGQDIRLLDGLATPIADNDELQIIASVAGG